jgi:hypothetical protein
MISQIPIDVTTAVDDGEITFPVELDGTVYQLSLSYCAAADLWYLSIAYLQGQVSIPIADSLALVCNVGLISAVQTLNRPPGELLLRGDIDPGRNQLQFTQLLYYDATEFAS